jgi:hypothetical protein
MFPPRRHRGTERIFLKNLKRALLAVGGGVGLTLAPFLLPISWNNAPRFFHWPMLLVDRPHATWLPLNAGNRLIALFLINISGWAVSLAVFWFVGSAITRREDHVGD